MNEAITLITPGQELFKLDPEEWQNTKLTQEKLNTTAKNSPNGSKELKKCSMMTLSREKTTLMPDLTLSWSTGDKECKKSQIGTNN